MRHTSALRKKIRALFIKIFLNNRFYATILRNLARIAWQGWKVWRFSQQIETAGTALQPPFGNKITSEAKLNCRNLNNRPGRPLRCGASGGQTAESHMLVCWFSAAVR